MMIDDVKFTLFASCRRFPDDDVAKEEPPAASTNLSNVFGSGLRSLAPLSNSQHSCFPRDAPPKKKNIQFCSHKLFI